MIEAALILRWTVGLLLLQAGISKARDLPAFRRGLIGYAAVPAGVVPLIGVTVPIVEIVLGVLLLLNAWVPIAASLTAVLFAGFFAAQLATLRRGLRVPCHCFGNDDFDRISTITVLRSFALGIAAASLAAPPSSRFIPDDGYVLAPIAVVAVVLVRGVTVIPIVAQALRTRAWLAPTPVSTRRISFRDAAPDATLTPHLREMRG